ncbi:hypothetical protein CPS_3865 [Colwellia psychrerythraea 34H]|uniref:Uncharacterized protein n=1 Tax=Colwellia psychrerythraea (strain 34H / ATCC BAA-681) TaxID=167879 RepID=Q47XE3_COLP3|nr:hypothetical protein CPS_3865 [Colwellia psychrerythraea 34H]
MLQEGRLLDMQDKLSSLMLAVNLLTVAEWQIVL